MPLPIDDPANRCPEINKARNILRWQATTGLEIGLKNTIEYFLNILKNQG